MRAPRSRTDHPRATSLAPMRFGIFYEHQLPRPWGDRRRAPAAPRRARADRDRRPRRLRHRLGGRAPLPRGVLALERVGRLPRGGLAAHAAHPARARDPAAAARLPAPRARRRDRRDARPGLRRPGRVRHGRDLERRRARGLRRRPRDEARAVGREPRRRHADVRRGAVRRHRGPLRLDAAAQRRPQAAPEAAPAAVGRVLAPRDDPPRRREGHRRAELLVRRAGGGRRVGRRVPGDHRVRALRAGRVRGQPAGRGRAADDVPSATRRRRSSAASTARTSSATRSRTTTSSATTGRAARTSTRSSCGAATRSASRAASIRAQDAPLGVRVLQQGLGSLRGAIGTPDQVRDLCRRYEAAGVDQVIFVLQAGRNRHEHICESLEIFGAEVLPEFAAEADAADRARDAELAGAIEAALRRRRAAARRRRGLHDRADRVRAARASPACADGHRAAAAPPARRAAARRQGSRRAGVPGVRPARERRRASSAPPDPSRGLEGGLRRDGPGLRARARRTASPASCSTTCAAATAGSCSGR